MVHKLVIEIVKKDFDNVIVKASQKVLYRDLVRMTLEGFGHNWKECSPQLDNNLNRLIFEGSEKECLRQKELFEASFQALGTQQINKIKRQASKFLKRKNVAQSKEEVITQWEKVAGYLSLMQIWVFVSVEPLDNGQLEAKNI